MFAAIMIYYWMIWVKHRGKTVELRNEGQKHNAVPICILTYEHSVYVN